MIAPVKKTNVKTPATLRFQRDVIDFGKDSYLSSIFCIQNQQDITSTGTSKVLRIAYCNSFNGGVYSDCKIEFKVEITDMYPIHPPKVTLLNRIYHPFVYNDKICIGLLREDWTPVLSLSCVLLSFDFLFQIDELPDVLHDPLSPEIGELYNENKPSFMENLRTSITGGTVNQTKYDDIRRR